MYDFAIFQTLVLLNVIPALLSWLSFLDRNPFYWRGSNTTLSGDELTRGVVGVSDGESRRI